MNVQKPREIAARVLRQRQNGGFVEDLLEAALARAQLSSADRRLCQEIAYGVVRWEATLDWLIARRTGGRPQKIGLQILLRLGLYQIFWLDRIPPHAAVYETVELTRQTAFQAQAGFVNAVLRSSLREADAIRKAIADLKITQPHLGYSHPDWLVDRWLKRWGAEKGIALLTWDNTPPTTFARLNTLKADAAQLAARWQEEKVVSDPVQHDWLEPDLVRELKSSPPLSQLPSFQQGWFYVQDPSTLLAVRALDPQPGESVLDLCAAPGGKLTYIAQLMRNQGRLVAHDSSPDRLRLIEQNCARLGLAGIETATPSNLDSLLQGSAGSSALFDRVLLDAPCSNTGAMRRRVDLRWRIQPGEIQRLRALQLDLLRQAATLVKPSGTLVYSTCSLEPEENGEVVREFLTRYPTLKLDYERELLPFAEGVDGAYVARLRQA